jgi:hypothetical protein
MVHAHSVYKSDKKYQKGDYMQVEDGDKETYLYINGLKALRPIQLNNNVELLPASGKYNPDYALKHITNDIDMGIIVLFMCSINSQIRITNNNPKELVVQAWNTQWDLMLLSAFFDNKIICNIQSNKPYENIKDDDCNIIITNYHLIGLNNKSYTLKEKDSKWIETNISKARELQKNGKFHNAIHCLASYKWHPLPRAQLAIIWAGIEGLFDVESEITFRLSLYISNFLASGKKRKEEMFKKIKNLYNFRSAAVHGLRLKDDLNNIVNDSAIILRKLILKCINDNAIPDKNNLLFS